MEERKKIIRPLMEEEKKMIRPLTEFCKKNRISLQELSRQSGVNIFTIIDIDTAKAQNVTFRTIEGINQGMRKMSINKEKIHPAKWLPKHLIFDWVKNVKL